MKSLESTIKKIEDLLIEKSILVDAIKRQSQLVVKQSAEVIQSIHRNIKPDIQALKKNYNQLLDVIGPNKEMLYLPNVELGMQEFTEAMLFFNYVYGDESLTPENLRVEEVPFILGIMDFTGELKRLAVNSIRNNDLDKAMKILDEMNSLYDLTMNFSHYIVSPDFKRKQDVLRNMLERLSGDISLITIEKKLIDSIESKYGKKSV